MMRNFRLCIPSYKHSWIVVAGIIIKAYISEDVNTISVKNMHPNVLSVPIICLN